jgi:hypothetical protein
MQIANTHRFRKIAAAGLVALASLLAFAHDDANAVTSSSAWKNGCVLTVYSPSYGADAQSGFTAGKAMVKCDRTVRVQFLYARLMEQRTLGFDTVQKEAGATGFVAPANTWMAVRYVDRSWKKQVGCYTAGTVKIDGWTLALNVNSLMGEYC